MVTVSACASCVFDIGCFEGKSTCPVSRVAKKDAVLANYDDPQVQEFAHNAACVEGQGYRNWDRAYEIVAFAKRMGYKHLGLAFCLSIKEEAGMYLRYLEQHGFQVASVMCKTGSVPKEEGLGISDDEKVRPGVFEPMCNPIAQAALLADAGVELNIVMGLCVGHDSLFISNAKGPVTCLLVKDRVYDHKPIEAIRLRDAGLIPFEPQQQRTPEQIKEVVDNPPKRR